MGGTVKSNSMNKVKLFVSASSDLSNDKQYIEKLQVIKGVIKNGEVETSIYDIKTSEPTKLDLNTCEVVGSGVKSMCALWEDKDFNKGDEAYYYVRVIANQSCRWSHDLCVKNPNYCQEDEDASIPKFIQERAWTSPVWLENS